MTGLLQAVLCWRPKGAHALDPTLGRIRPEVLEKDDTMNQLEPKAGGPMGGRLEGGIHPQIPRGRCILLSPFFGKEAPLKSQPAKKGCLFFSMAAGASESLVFCAGGR